MAVYKRFDIALSLTKSLILKGDVKLTNNRQIILDGWELLWSRSSLRTTKQSSLNPTSLSQSTRYQNSFILTKVHIFSFLNVYLNFSSPFYFPLQLLFVLIFRSSSASTKPSIHLRHWQGDDSVGMEASWDAVQKVDFYAPCFLQSWSSEAAQWGMGEYRNIWNIGMLSFTISQSLTIAHLHPFYLRINQALE